MLEKPIGAAARLQRIATAGLVFQRPSGIVLVLALLVLAVHQRLKNSQKPKTAPKRAKTSAAGAECCLRRCTDHDDALY